MIALVICLFQLVTGAFYWGELEATQAKQALEQLAADEDKRVQLHAIAALKQI